MNLFLFQHNFDYSVCVCGGMTCAGLLLLLLLFRNGGPCGPVTQQQGDTNKCRFYLFFCSFNFVLILETTKTDQNMTRLSRNHVTYHLVGQQFIASFNWYKDLYYKHIFLLFIIKLFLWNYFEKEGKKMTRPSKCWPSLSLLFTYFWHF